MEVCMYLINIIKMPLHYIKMVFTLTMNNNLFQFF